MTRIPRPAIAKPPRGFTLVELLTVMALIGVLMGMTAVMMGSVRESARINQTRSLISTIDEILMTKWESYATRPLPVVIPNFGAGAQNTRIEVPPRESARVRLMMLRDLMRMELPDRYSDILESSSIPGAIPPATRIAARAVYTEPDGITQSPVNTIVNWTPPAAVANYQSRVTSTADPLNASSEMLYLILSTTSFNGISALELIPKRNIGDTDEDGMLEILDAWGNAIGFIRWPVGYVPPGGATTSPDEFDFMQVDWGYAFSPPAPPPSLKPLIVSSGPDGIFNLRFTQDPETPYRLMRWPTNQMGSEGADRQSPYYYVDPYLRQYSDNGLLGELLNNTEDHLDNITNYNVNEST